MDTRELIQLKESILVEVRRLLNAKFNTGSEELSSDSKLAIQQLSGAVSAIRDELSKTHSSFRLITLSVDDINQRISVLGAELKDSRIIKEIGDLKIANDKLWDHIVASDGNNRLAVIEKAIADVVNRMAAIEKVAATPVKRNPAEVHSANVDHAAIQDVTSRMGDVLTQLQGVKLQIEDVNLRVITPVTKTEIAVDPSLNLAIDRLQAERDLQKLELLLLKDKLEKSENTVADLDARFKAFTTLSLNHVSLNSNGIRLDSVAEITGVEPRLEALETKMNVISDQPHHHPVVVQPPVNFDFPQTLLFGTKLT